MFEQLSDRLNAIFSRLTGRGRLSESDVSEVMREVRIALLEADVSLSAAKEFVNAIKEKAIGADVMASLSPAQTIVKIVHEELVELLGGAEARLQFADAPPSVIMLVGLQGSGKTTHAGKLALRLKEQGRRTLLVAADVYRPAAIAQLQTLGKQIDLPVFEQGQSDPVKIAREGVGEARRLGISTVIIDTAGRLQIDEDLMAELERIKAAVNPKEILLVADAMTGQEATNVAKGLQRPPRHHGRDSHQARRRYARRCGAVDTQSHRCADQVHRRGRKLSALEPFYPDRLASRILGMGDVLTLIERTQNLYTEEQAKNLEQKMLKQQFTLDDFLDQMRQIRKMGSMTDILKMIPGVSRALPKDFEIPDADIRRIEAIICSMTRRERQNPDILNGSRRKRIAHGSGTQVADVNRLVKRFEEARKMMKQMGFGGKKRPRLPMGMLGR